MTVGDAASNERYRMLQSFDRALELVEAQRTVEQTDDWERLIDAHIDRTTVWALVVMLNNALTQDAERRGVTVDEVIRLARLRAIETYGTANGHDLSL